MTDDTKQTRSVTNRRPVDEISATTAEKLINKIDTDIHGSTSVAKYLYNSVHRSKNSIEQWWIHNVPNAGVLLVGMLAISVSVTAAGYFFLGIFDSLVPIATLRRQFIASTIIGGGGLTAVLMVASLRTPGTRVWHRDQPDRPILTERIVSTNTTEATITVDSVRKVPLPYEMAQTDTGHGIETCDMDGRSLLSMSYARSIDRALRSKTATAELSASSPTDWPLVQLLKEAQELPCPWEIRVSILGSTELRGYQQQHDTESSADRHLHSRRGAQVSIQLLTAPSAGEESAVRTDLAQLPALPMADGYLHAGEPREIAVSEADDPLYATPRTERTTQSGLRCRYVIGVTSTELLRTLTVPKGMDPAVDDIIETQFGGQPRAPPDSGHTGLDTAADTASGQSSVDASPHDASEDDDDGPWEWPNSTDSN